MNIDYKACEIKYFSSFFAKNSIIGNGVQFMNIIIEKDAAAYILKHSKDNSVTLYIRSAVGG
jgi:hypothetical protein